jgi:pimeloyl-ACP methyl ester carboxylesterase
MRPKLLATVTVAALASTLAAVPAPAAARTTTPALAWGDCPPPLVERDPRQRCTTVSVPYDHGRPDGRTVDLAVSRIATAKPGLRRGALFLNLGGPGDVGIDAWSYLLGLGLPAAVTDRYDLIGIDPRGNYNSAPVSCGFPAAPLDVEERYPAADGSIDRNIAYARDLARRCAANGGDLMPTLSTATWARDMDLVRAALGERKISFLGYSYGTYLGAVYRTMFPHRADRFVLDSNYDPALPRYEGLRLANLGASLRLPEFTRWVAARDERYHLGTTSAAVRRVYDGLVARLDADPLVLPDGTEINGNRVRIETFVGMFVHGAFPSLAELWQALVAATASGRVPAQLGDRARAATSTQIPADNVWSVQTAVHCNDGGWPRDLDTYRRNVAVDRRLFPAFAGFAANVHPCTFWPFPAQPAVRVGPTGRRSVLIVQNLRDPATPWVGGLGMQRALRSDAVLVSVDQGGHTAYLKTASACANDTVTAFLAHGVLPAGPRLCPGQELPA